MADERRGETVEASPEEARFLRRFVRRTVLPWFASVGALAGLALGVALSPPPRVGAEPGVAQPSAALDELRAEVASLRDALAALRSARPVESQPPGDLELRLAKLEAALASWPAPESREAAGGPATDSARDLAAIRDRLYELERSVQSEAAARAGSREGSEQRIERLELRLSELEGLSAGPASQAR